MKIEEKANIFWQWFEKNNTKFIHLEKKNFLSKNRLLNKFEKHLKKYHQELYFEIGEHPKRDTMELIISAGGNIDFFDIVETLIGKAPSLALWQFIAFKQPKGTQFKLVFEGIEFVPKNIQFIALENIYNPKVIGISICFADYTEEKRDLYLGGCCIMLETIIGEKSFALDIDHIELQRTCPDIPDYQLKPLSELAEYITAIKNE